MSNITTNITAATIDTTIQEYYELYIIALSLWSSTALLFYVTLSRLGQEVEFIWLGSPSWPAFLYISARYGELFNIVFTLWLYYVPSSGRVCNILSTIEGVFGDFGFIGVQGLLVARAHALWDGNKILPKALTFFYLSGVIIGIALNLIYKRCIPSIVETESYTLIILCLDIIVISTDLLVFAICMWKIWSMWGFGREAGIPKRNSLFSILFEQNISRCCFVIVVTVAVSIMGYRFPSSYISYCLTLYQNSLSSILLADFTLDLRVQERAGIEADNISLYLSSISFSSNAQQSILVEISPNSDVEDPDALDDIIDFDDNVLATIDTQSA